MVCRRGFLVNAERFLCWTLALGLSYGLMENMFLDLGLRFTYIPRINWTLNNELASNVPTGAKHRDVFSANNVIYTSALIGLRFEF